MKRLLSLLIPAWILMMEILLIPVRAEDISGYPEEIIAFHSGGGSVQNWIDGALTENAGISSEWYILALSQSGDYDFSSYQNALHEYLATHEIYSASSRLKYALALASCGEHDGYITESLENSIGQQGIMSWIYGLHLLNNGFLCESCSQEAAVSQLLSMQLEDGGWAVMGTAGDIDVTAMAVQALAVSYPANPDVQSACDRAITFLSAHQQEYGGYQSFGTENLESTAQVVTALASLGIDGFSDERFIKNDNTLLTGMLTFRQPDGSYSHTRDGGYNETATIQAFYTFIAYQRMQNGQPPLYLLDPKSLPEPEPETEPETLPEPEQEMTPELLQIPETSVVSETVMPEATVPEMSQTSGTNTETSVQTSATVSETSATETTSTSVPESTSLPRSETTVTSISETFSKPETAVTSTETSVIPEQKQTVPHQNRKLLIIGIIAGTGILFCLLLWILKRRSWKNFLVIGILVLGASGAVWFIRIQSPEEYYHQSAVQKENPSGTVSITIRCDTLIGKADSEAIPADGVILEKTEIPLSEGETVYDILMQTAQAYGIQTEHNSSYYISGIQYLYEMQYGDLSGWMYRVNGEMPSVGCAEYFLKDGDFIEWLYSCEIGNDLD